MSTNTGTPAPASDVLVIGAGPAGAVAALRAADLGARTALVDQLRIWRHGRQRRTGSGADPGPCRRAGHARLASWDYMASMCGEPVLDYPRLLGRVREVVSEVVAHSSLREQIDSAGVTVYEKAGNARFADPHTIITEGGLHLRADKIIICVGGVSRQLPIPGLRVNEYP